MLVMEERREETRECCYDGRDASRGKSSSPSSWRPLKVPLVRFRPDAAGIPKQTVDKMMATFTADTARATTR